MREIKLEFCAATDARYEGIRNRHYVLNRGAHGQQVHFLIWLRNETVGIISGGSAVYAVKARDEFFGINRNREKVLNGIIDNTVFRLEVHEKNLATQVLALWRKTVSTIWEDLYGVKVFGFETFVVENARRTGAVYKADNWTFAGASTGNAKHSSGVTPAGLYDEPTNIRRAPSCSKLIFCKWHRGINAPVESGYVSCWRGQTERGKDRAHSLTQKRGSYLGRMFS
jgi:hypothetical protein